MKKICITIIMMTVLILCLCGCADTNMDINGTYELETISTEEGKLVFVGSSHIVESDLPKKNIKCEIKSDLVVVFTENETTSYNGTYTMEKVQNSMLLHVSMESGKVFDITCGEKKSNNGISEMTMIFDYEKNIVVFSKK